MIFEVQRSARSEARKEEIRKQEMEVAYEYNFSIDCDILFIFCGNLDFAICFLWCYGTDLKFS